MKNKIIIALLVNSFLLIGCGGSQETDNAQLETDISPVIPKINSYVTDVLVQDNQAVKEGDVLIKLDDANYLIAVQQAEVALALAKANVIVSQNSSNTANTSISAVQSNGNAANAIIDAAKARVDVATKNYNRFKTLLEQNSATQQQFDNVKAEKLSAEAQLKAAQSQAQASNYQVATSKSAANTSQSGVNVAQLSVKQAENALAAAKLQLSYCTIIAPSNGVVSKKNVQKGQVVGIGQPLMAITNNDKIWVVANFKETQIADIKVGQEATIEVDAYSGKEFKANVQSFAQATGAKFSLLPPDNASGNFVKVTQRIPIKIVLSEKPTNEFPLRAGMSVKVSVKTKS